MSHDHDSHSSEKNIGVAFFLNLFFMVIEFVGGLLTNSVAIVSDAVHDLGDSLSLALAWYFQKLSKKGKTRQYSYGYKRFSLLGAIINSVVLVVGSIYIISEAIPRLASPQPANARGMFLLAIFGIIINGAAVLRTRKAHSINEKVVSLHLLEDVLGWVAVLLGAAVIHFTGWYIIDPILSLLIACFVLANVYKNIRRVMPILLQGTPVDMEQGELVERLKGIEGVADVHDLHIWSLDEKYAVLTVHLILEKRLSMDELSELKQKARSLLKNMGVEHTTIELELPDEKCDYKDCL